MNYSLPLLYTPAVTPPVPVFKDRNFVLTPPEQAGDILLVGKDDKKGYGNGKSPVKGLLCVKNV
jgi:hypothetical protein